MDVLSRGLRTELALRCSSGSSLDDRGDHLVLRTPDNPTFWWGNCLALAAAPRDLDSARHWLDTFERELPGSAHRTFHVDGLAGDVAELEPFAALGFTTETSVVMTADEVREPSRPHRDATYRPLLSDDDWSQQVGLALATGGASADRTFCERKARADRALVDRGLGRWYGAFVGPRLVSSMGLFAASHGLARFQSVATHPDVRRQGIAGTLTYVVARFGLDELGADTLVMVADPDGPAVGIYRAVGFEDSETMLTAERPPAG